MPKQKPKELSHKDVWALIFATYRATFPYLLVFILVMLFATWFITEVIL